MATLDVLEYTTRLEEALEPRLPRGDRRQAAKEARHVLELMAFRFALMDERPFPEEEDWARALDALKPPREAAEVLLKRAPVYRRRRLRRKAVSYTILLGLGLLAALVTQISLSEVSTPLLYHNEGVGTVSPATTVTKSFFLNFTVPEGTSRLQVGLTGLVNVGFINVTVMDPEARLPFAPPHDEPVSFRPRGGPYEYMTLDHPVPGEWTIVVDYVGARGSLEITAQAVRPRAAR